ncbi:MAG TPA: hypothetical protein VHW09_09015 [Bryobacteraceae bacterium]|nr:hypothetical protein [Bryobacteraceae bacterium]
MKSQLARLLGSPLFHHSKHYPSFLRYVVQETLEGRGGHLKERALGVEVFGRGADYDTNADPVVRTSACEVRKRIAQYYHELGHEHEIRIDLPSGSYLPEFRYPAVAPPPLTLVEPPPVAVTALSGLRIWAQKRSGLAAAAGLAVLTGIGAGVWSTRTPSAIDQFWGPVWGAEDSVMVAVGNPTGGNYMPAPSEAGLTFLDVMRADNMAFADALTMARIAGVAREYAGKTLDVRRATTFTLTDLRKGPLILVGGFNNPWTMRLTKDLRFALERLPDHTGIIRDRQHPENRSWFHDAGILYSQLNQDYALVSRFVDPLTERTVVVVAGMGRDGTLAAGEFVSEPRYLEMLARRAPKHWGKKNFQVVLATDVVRGNTGPPRILATHFW